MHKEGEVKLLIPNNFTVAIALKSQVPSGLSHRAEVFSPSPPQKAEDPINQEAKAQGAMDVTG